MGNCTLVDSYLDCRNLYARELTKTDQIEFR